MRVTRALGNTQTERFLARLCDQCFLSLWSYPSPYNDRGGNNRPSGQELCDLLVIFGNDIIIFSDKACQYPQCEDQVLNWKRWYKKAIKESVDQIYGAERWLRKHPDRIFLDRACSQKLPLQLDLRRMQVHRIVVAIGSAQSRKGRGLALRPNLLGDAEPHTIGRMNTSGGFIHILDEASLWRVMDELSTTADFVEYLRAKEEWIESGGLAFAASELDLLAFYLGNAHAFPASAKSLALPSSTWQRFAENPRQEVKKAANGSSFFWDRLIEYFNQQYNEYTLEYGNDLSLSDYELAVRMMAGETRLSRRCLSNEIIDRMYRASDGWVSCILVSANPQIAYVLLVGPGSDEASHLDYRKRRTEELGLRCHVAKVVHPEARWFVGLALDARGAVGSSEDLMLIDTNDWGPSEIAQAQAIQAAFGYFLPGKVRVTDRREWEYPGSSAPPPPNLNRRQRRAIAALARKRGATAADSRTWHP